MGKPTEGRNIPPIITLTAALVTCIFCIVRHATLFFTLKLVLPVMLIFFIIGVIVQKIVVRINKDAEEAAVQRQREALEKSAEDLTETEQGAENAATKEEAAGEAVTETAGTE